MQLYGPYALTKQNIELFITRVLPGVCLLCDSRGIVSKTVYSSFHIGEAVQQWVPQYAQFYFCYTETGAQAERMYQLLGDCVSHVMSQFGCDSGDWLFH